MVVVLVLAVSLPNLREQNLSGEVKALLELDCGARWGQHRGIFSMRIPTATRPLKK